MSTCRIQPVTLGHRGPPWAGCLIKPLCAAMGCSAITLDTPIWALVGRATDQRLRLRPGMPSKERSHGGATTRKIIRSAPSP